MKNAQIIVPCYNEEENIRALYEEVKSVFQGLPEYAWSLFFVDDGSRDATVERIKELRTEDAEHIDYLTFSRNFGKEAAIYAGLKNSTGDVVVLMDADLQHPPALLPELFKGIEEGYDCCGARRVSRKGEPPVRSFFSNLFYRMINRFTSMELVPGGSDYRAMRRQMVDAVLELTERERFIKGILSWVGFETKWIPYHNVERHAGKSKWTFIGLGGYALNGFIAFATKPLRIATYTGSLIVLISFFYAIYTFVDALVSGKPRTGYATILLFLLFLGGVIITLLGIIGEYIARIYTELKHRPIYIEKENTLSSIKNKKT